MEGAARAEALNPKPQTLKPCGAAAKVLAVVMVVWQGCRLGRRRLLRAFYRLLTFNYHATGKKLLLLPAVFAAAAAAAAAATIITGARCNTVRSHSLSLPLGHARGPKGLL